jgi:hypothetical protein
LLLDVPIEAAEGECEGGGVGVGMREDEGEWEGAFGEGVCERR